MRRRRPPPPEAHPSKTCRVCGRSFAWRRKWARCWDQVKYCSENCRRSRRAVDTRLEQLILDLLGSRARDATICPSEVARAVAGAEDWRQQLEPVRQAARRLAAAGKLVFLQRGRAVDPSRARGPVRLKLVRRRHT
jgi:hypothetical protein